MNYATELQTIFAPWKLRLIRKFWTQNHFCAFLGVWDIWQTKWGYEAENSYSYWPAVAVSASEKPQDNPTDIGEAPKWLWYPLINTIWPQVTQTDQIVL